MSSAADIVTSLSSIKDISSIFRGSVRLRTITYITCISDQYTSILCVTYVALAYRYSGLRNYLRVVNRIAPTYSYIGLHTQACIGNGCRGCCTRGNLHRFACMCQLSYVSFTDAAPGFGARRRGTITNDHNLRDDTWAPAGMGKIGHLTLEKATRKPSSCKGKRATAVRV